MKGLLFTLCFFLELFFIGCQESSIIEPTHFLNTSYVTLDGVSIDGSICWQDLDGLLVTQPAELDTRAEEYYAEITNEEDRRFSVNIGLPDEQGRFKIKFSGRIKKVEIYNDRSDL